MAEKKTVDPMPCTLREIRNTARSKGLGITMNNWANYVTRNSQYYAVFQELIARLRKIAIHTASYRTGIVPSLFIIVRKVTCAVF
jgi:hypothetical protein